MNTACVSTNINSSCSTYLYKLDCSNGKTVLQNTNSSLKARVFITELFGRCVVVKDYSHSHPIIRATLCRWFIEREIAALKRLKAHPSIPLFLGNYGKFGLVMELIEGQVLKKSLLRNKPRLMNQLDTYIKDMHELGVTHNDIRMRNLLIDSNGTLHIIDFTSAVIKPKYSYSLLTLLYHLTKFSDQVKVVRFKKQFHHQSLNSNDTKLIKFISPLKFLSMFWKKIVYERLKSK